jgi:hypothetical protein
MLFRWIGILVNVLQEMSLKQYNVRGCCGIGTNSWVSGDYWTLSLHCAIAIQIQGTVHLKLYPNRRYFLYIPLNIMINECSQNMLGESSIILKACTNPLDQTGWRSNEASDSYSASPRLETRPGHQISWLRLFMVVLSSFKQMSE